MIVTRHTLDQGEDYMAQLRPNPPEHIVSVDTNILWFEDKGCVVNPKFDEFWNSYSTTFPMKLIIPAVVRGELLFQQITSALKLLDKANSNIRAVTRITGKQYSHRILKDRVTKEATKRFDKWVQSQGAEVCDTPIDDIDWSKLIDAAIWRRLPFTPDPENPKNEKGFRDALILETMDAICRSYSEEANIAFVCNDFALRKAADYRLSGIEGFSTYESLEDFATFINLTKRNLTERFVKSILSRARDKFFNEKGKKGLFYSDDYFTKLRDEFKARIESPMVPEEVIYGVRGWLNAWTHVGNEQTWIGNPLFEKVAEDNIYYWVSTITFVRLYEREQAIFTDSSGGKERRLLILTIDVHWQASVRADGRFFNCTVVNHKESNYSFEVPTQDKLERYGIQNKDKQAAPEDSQ